MFGFSFANPGMLYGLFAALLPLAIHLLNRQRTMTVPFSNVALLQALQHDRMRRVKLKQIVLLILRTLLILLLVLAFARPTLTRSGGRMGDSGTSAVILLDRSLSMQYRAPEGALFEQARGRVRDLLGLFQPRDDVHLVVFDAQSQVVEPAQLDALQPGFAHTDLQPALATAAELLAGSQMPNRELFVVTDLARNGWVSLPDSIAGLDGVSVFVVPVRPASAQNLGIVNAHPIGGMLQVGQPATLEIELINHSDAPRGDVPVQAFLDERRIVQQIAHVPARDRRKLHARFVPETGGAVALRVEIGDDDLIADNTRVSMLAIPEQIRALLVADRDEDAYYLMQALRSAEVEPLLVRSDDVDDRILDRADVIFLCNVSQVPRQMLSMLQARVAAGVGLAIVLGDRVDVRHYNAQVLPALCPATLMSVQGVPNATTTYQVLPAGLPDHPMLTDLKQGGSFQSPRFFVFYLVRPETETVPVLSLTTGAPILLEHRQGMGRTMLFASALHTDLTWTDLPITGFFLPFVHRLSGYLAAGAFGRADYGVGQTVYRDIRGDLPREAVLRPPGLEAQTIWPEQRGVRAVWPVGVVETPGLWEIYARERVNDRFAVQIDPMEADLSEISEQRIAQLFRKALLRVVPTDQALAPLVLTQRHGREMWRPVLVGVLLLMVVEMLLARSTQTSRKMA